jgi:purine-cytosine permease-like protein
MMNFFWGLLLGYIVGVLFMAYRSNIDKRTNIE